ncbi:DNA glycosylase AlkZ-like family protein [Microlunatus capsulatus]|uniref:Winged helix DNA-binding domain-containing protein n=1 Tax=Microlunatus capsulatus TaxID=99117 RepID=A0ABS4Z5K5_9ACTN|nr:crosslink repair DNA glycosylase YcaQ family protein [Microlunatus capsulatus]MBP2416022.1 hypothetical protein [Microlunatus capsulatus]
MTRLSTDELARRTLVRQFPAVRGTDGDAVTALLTHLGPVQSQVPRSPFLTASSRLPGVDRATVRRLFEEHRLVKTSSLRGTVHTGVAAHHPLLDAASRPARRQALTARLRLGRVSVDQLWAELEAFAADAWQARPALVEHARQWLAVHESAAAAAALDDTSTAALVGSHSGLLRRPPDQRWETRTDVLHRTARAVLPGPAASSADAAPSADEALAALVPLHLGALGPATRAELAHVLGATLGAVDRAVAAAGDTLVRLDGPDDEVLVELAEPGADGPGPDPVVLLPEFDALLVGLHPAHRTRFLGAEQLAAVWSKVNGVCAPTVLHDGRVVGTWRTVVSGTTARVEVRALPGARLPDEAALAAPATAAATALGLDLREVRLL